MSAPVKEGDVLGGKFRVERVLGTGGMGVIVAAYHLQLEQHVALKFLLPEAAKEEGVVLRFAREARAAAKIQSEHVARVLDVGTLDTGAPYMVMEYLEGHDLDQLIKARGALPAPEAVGYLMQACEAVAEAHALGIVHRDLKPANIFVADRADGRKSVKVLDFGISKVMPAASQQAEPSLTKTSAIMGSPMYMSPEQLRSSRDVDARADIWALGVVLYEMLSGNGPFSSGTVAEVCAGILKDTPKPLRETHPDVPAGLDAVVQRCLEKDVEKRYSNVAELTVALLSFGPPGCEVSIERVSSVLRNMALSQRGGPTFRRDLAGSPIDATSPEIPSAKEATPIDASAARAALELAATKASRPAGLVLPTAAVDALRPTEPGGPIAIAASKAAADASATASAVSRSSWNAKPPASPPGRGRTVMLAGLGVVAAAGVAFAVLRSRGDHDAESARPAASASATGDTPEPSAVAAPPTPSESASAVAAPTAAAAEPPDDTPSEAPAPDPHKMPWGKPRATASAAVAPPSAVASAAAPPPSASAAAKAPATEPSASAKASPSASPKAAPSASAKAGPRPSATPAAGK